MRLPLYTVGLVVLALVGRGATSFAQDSAGPAVTGRAIPCKDGRIGSFPCHNVELLAFLPNSATGGLSGSDLWGWIDSTTHREFIILGGSRVVGTAFVEVTDPVNPKYLGLLPLHGGLQLNGPDVAQSVKVYKNHAFIGYTAKNGLQVFDLTQLRNVTSPPVVFSETAHYGEITNTHTIALNEETGFLYANGTGTCSGGLHMVDVRVPTKPTFAGCFSEPTAGGLSGAGYVHDTQCVVYHGPDRRYDKREICLAASGSAIVIVDVTDKQQPKEISIVTYPNVGYAHQGWLTQDHQYFFLDDELDEGTVGQTRTIGFDLTKLDEPVVLTEFLNTTTDTDHNLYIRGRYAYQGNTTEGLRIIDIGNPKNLKEAGYLTDIGWTWGTYPYLKDNVVAVSTTAGLALARLLAP